MVTINESSAALPIDVDNEDEALVDEEGVNGVVQYVVNVFDGEELNGDDLFEIEVDIVYPSAIILDRNKY